MNLQPLNDLVFVEKSEAVEKIGSLFVPGNASQDAIQGKVVAVGSGLYTDSGVLLTPTVKVRDVVLVSPSTGLNLTLDGRKLVAMHERDILAIIRA